MQYSGKVSTAGILASIEHLYQVPYLGEASSPASGNINRLAQLVGGPGAEGDASGRGPDQPKSLLNIARALGKVPSRRLFRYVDEES